MNNNNSKFLKEWYLTEEFEFVSEDVLKNSLVDSMFNLVIDKVKDFISNNPEPKEDREFHALCKYIMEEFESGNIRDQKDKALVIMHIMKKVV